MKIHHDILACHAQFGGDLEDMQRRYDAPDMLAALKRAERKLAAYVGVCNGDKELTDTVLPMVRAAISKAA